MAVTDSVKIWESVLEACSHTDNVTLYGKLGEQILRGNKSFDPHMPLGQGRLSLSTDGDKCAMVNFFLGGE